MNQYELTAKYYDFLNKLSKDELMFYKKHLKRNINVLELGCGTGRLTLELAKYSSGIKFDCVDLSKTMLNEFERKINYLNKGLTYLNRNNLINESMEKYTANKKYDLILYSGQSIQCLPRNKIYAQLEKTLDYCKSQAIIIITLINTKIENINTLESINGFTSFNSNSSYIESIYSSNKINDKVIIGINNYEYDNGNIVKYKLKLRIFDGKSSWVEKIIEDDFEIGSVDYNFVNNLHERLPLERIGFYSTYKKQKCTSDDKNYICIYKYKGTSCA
jgi:SAM-dependent methyltransferase